MNCNFYEGIDTCKEQKCDKNIMGMCTKKGSKNYPDVPHRTYFEKLKLMNIEQLSGFLAEEIMKNRMAELPLEIRQKISKTEIKMTKLCLFREYYKWLQSEVEE